MAPRKPARLVSAATADPVECSTADLASNLKDLLHLDFDSDVVPQLLQLFDSIAGCLILSGTLNPGIWEAAKKHRLPLALSKICGWALSLLSTQPVDHLTVHLTHRAALMWAQVIKASMQQAESAPQGSLKDDCTVAGWLVKELLRLEVPNKLLRAALALHDFADTLLPHEVCAALLGPNAPPSAADGNTESMKTWALEMAGHVVMNAQSCTVSAKHGREVSMQLIELMRAPGFSQSLIRLCKLALDRAPRELPKPGTCLRIAMYCSDLLGKAIEAAPAPAGSTAGLDLQLDMMQGLLDALGTLLLARQQRATSLASSGCHLSFISTALERLSDAAHTRWLQQPRGSSGGSNRNSSPLSQRPHDLLANSREQLLLAGLYMSAWHLLDVAPTSEAEAGDLETLHGAAANILYLLLSLRLLEVHDPPPPLNVLGRVLKLEHWWRRPEHLRDASASAAALSYVLRLATFLVTDSSAHSGGSLGLGNASVVSGASALLLEYGHLSKVRPVLAVFRRATHAVLMETVDLSLEAGGTMVLALNDAVMKLLMRPPPHPPLHSDRSDVEPAGGDVSPEWLPDHRTTAVCLELLPSVFSAGTWGLETALENFEEAVQHGTQEEAARVLIAAAGSSSSATVVATSAESLEILPMQMWEIGEGALRAILAACAAARANHRLCEPVLPHPPGSGCGSSGGGGHQAVLGSSRCGTLDMLFVLSSASVAGLLSSVSSCLKKLLPVAVQVLICPGNSDKGEPEQQQQRQQQRQGCTTRGGRSAAKAKAEAADGGPDARDGAASSQHTTAAVASLRLLRLAAVCLGGLLELGAAAVEEAAGWARCSGTMGGGLSGMRSACGIIRSCLDDTDLLRAVMCEDAVRLLYGVLQAGPSDQSEVDGDWQLLLAERQHPGTADLLPILLLGVAESQASCCRALAGSLLDRAASEAHFCSHRQRFEAHVDIATGLAEQLAIRCAMLCARVAAAPGQGQEAEGRQLSPAAVEDLAAEVREAADLGLQLTQSMLEALGPAVTFQVSAEAMDILTTLGTTEGLRLSKGMTHTSTLRLRQGLADLQTERMACIQGYAQDWSLLSSALNWAIARGRPISAFADALLAGELVPHTVRRVLSEAAAACGQPPAECGSPACPNVGGWIQCRDGRPPLGWRRCRFGCSTWFCCRDCEEEAGLQGHEEACDFLCSLRRAVSGRSSSSEEMAGSSSSQYDHGDGSVANSSSGAGGSADTQPLSPYEDGIDTGSAEDDSVCMPRQRWRLLQELHDHARDEPEEQAAASASARVDSGELEEELERYRAEHLQWEAAQTAGQRWREGDGAREQQYSDDAEDWHHDFDDGPCFEDAEGGQYEAAGEIAGDRVQEGGESEGEGQDVDEGTVGDEDEWETDDEGEDTDIVQHSSQVDGESQVAETTAPSILK